MVQNSTKKQRNIIIASIIIVVLIISSISTWIILYEPLKVKHVPTSINLHVSLNQSNVLQGSNLQAELNVTSIGKAENITLGSNVGSSGIVCSYDPATDTSNFTSLLTINVPNSTPTGNYTLIAMASGVGETANASFVIPVLSANVMVSGNVIINTGFEVWYLTSITFKDTQTNATFAATLSSSPYNAEQNVYSITLQNEHAYRVTVGFAQGDEEIQFPDSFNAGNFYVYAPAGNSTISGHNFSG